MSLTIFYKKYHFTIVIITAIRPNNKTIIKISKQHRPGDRN